MTENRAASALSTSECWAMLRSSEVGRLAVCAAEGPDIFPLNYVVDHGTLVIRTAEGSKLPDRPGKPRVAFEVDAYSTQEGHAWSVVLKGTVQAIRLTDELIDALRMPLAPWHAAADQRYFRLVPDDVSGRRFRRPDSQ